jgi:hypothetical protein
MWVHCDGRARLVRACTPQHRGQAAVAEGVTARDEQLRDHGPTVPLEADPAAWCHESCSRSHLNLGLGRIVVQKRCTDSLSEYDIKWMNSSIKRQCDQALHVLPPPPPPPLPALPAPLIAGFSCSPPPAVHRGRRAATGRPPPLPCPSAATGGFNYDMEKCILYKDCIHVVEPACSML